MSTKAATTSAGLASRPAADRLADGALLGGAVGPGRLAEPGLRRRRSVGVDDERCGARHLGVDDLRRQFALVLQEPVLFSTTIGENIAYARSDATRDEIIAALSARDIEAREAAAEDRECDAEGRETVPLVILLCVVAPGGPVRTLPSAAPLNSAGNINTCFATCLPSCSADATPT